MRYRYLTGPDDSNFGERVTKALGEGWELHGAPTLTYDAETARLMCGQAVVKPGQVVKPGPSESSLA